MSSQMQLLQVSLWNFVSYNVIGGGDSALYGTESASYYLRNGVLNLNIALPLALLAPAWLALSGYVKAGKCLHSSLASQISCVFLIGLTQKISFCLKSLCSFVVLEELQP